VRSTELLNVHTGVAPIADFCAVDIQAFTQPGSRWSRIKNDESVSVSNAFPWNVIDPTMPVDGVDGVPVVGGATADPVGEALADTFRNQADGGMAADSSWSMFDQSMSPASARLT